MTAMLMTVKMNRQFYFDADSMRGMVPVLTAAQFVAREAGRLHIPTAPGYLTARPDELTYYLLVVTHSWREGD